MAITTTMATDANSNPIQQATGFLLVDGTATPQVSPIAAGTTELALIAPANAISVSIKCLSADAKLRKVAGGATGGIFTITQNIDFDVGCKPGDTIYIGRPVSTSVEFAFDIIA